MTATEQGGAAPRWETLGDQAARLGRVGAWAPGSYLCKCVGCERTFEGDKRALSCLPCAVARLDRIASRLTVEELAGVIEANNGGLIPKTLAVFNRRIAQALLDHITAETEVKP